MLEYVKIVGEAGAIGILAVILYLFCTGRIISEPSVKRLMDAQANHIGDLKDAIKKELQEIKEVLKDIRKNSAINPRK